MIEEEKAFVVFDKGTALLLYGLMFYKGSILFLIMPRYNGMERIAEG